MNIRYSLVNWVFHSTRFSQVLTEMHAHFSWSEMGEILDVSKTTVNNWANGNWSDEFPHPHMKNFIVVCNMMDLDPRDFWILEDK